MRHTRYVVFSLLLGLVHATSVAPGARASEPAPRSSGATRDESAELGPEYQEAISQALTEVDLAHYEEARALFAKAHAIAPSARTWRGLGMVEFELRHYLASIDALEHALRDPVRRLDSELRAQTEAVLLRAREFVTRVELALSPDAQSSVLVDGESVQRRADGSLLLPVGDHVLEVNAAGFRAERRNLSLVGGRAERVQVVLSPQLAVGLEEPRPERSTPPADKPAKPVYKSPWLWVGLGVAVVGAVVLGVTLGTREEPEAKFIQGDRQVGDGLVHTLRFGP